MEEGNFSKTLVSADKVMVDSFKLARQIMDSGFRPNVMYSVIRGGSATANVVSEVFTACGIENKLAATITKSYDGTEQNTGRIVKIGGYTLMPYEIKPLSKVLIIEDLVDSGYSLGSIIADILDQNVTLRREDIKVAVMTYKCLGYTQTPKTVKLRRLYERDRQRIYEFPNSFGAPDFFVEKIDIAKKEDNPWVSYPHEIIDISLEEISHNIGPEAAEIVKDLRERYNAR